MDSQGNAKEETAGFSIIASDDGYPSDKSSPANFMSNVQDFACGDTKTCNVCCEEKPITEFHREASGALGRKAKCKSCKSVYDKAHNVRKKPNILDRQVALENAYYRAIKDGII